MLRYCITILLALAASVAQAQSFTGPETADIGQPIKFQVTDVEGGDLITWQVLTPRGDQTTVIETTYGVEFIVDAGCNYSGPVEVLCTLVNFDKQRFSQEVLDCMIEGQVPDIPDNPDVPDNPDSNVEPDQFDNLGRSIDQKATQLGLTRRADVAKDFKSIHDRMENFDLRTRQTVDAEVVKIATKYRPEWDEVFAIMSENGAKYNNLVWSEAADWYLAVSRGANGR